jgi:hypothetical protein
MSLSSEARAAKALGLTRFIPSPELICKLHNGEHYTASGACCECHRQSRKPDKQAAYWAANKEKHNLAKKARYYASKTPTVQEIPHGD